MEITITIGITVAATLGISVPTTIYFTRRYYLAKNTMHAAPIVVGGTNNNVTVQYTNDQKPEVIEQK